MSPVLLAAGFATAAVVLAWPPSWLRMPVIALPRRHRPVREAERRAAELAWVEALAAELRAGGDPAGALAAAGDGGVEAVAPQARAAALSGADVAAALRADATGRDLLAGVAACWDVAAGTGAGLAAALVTLADAARETERIRRELQAGLAEPKATAVVLAGLPLVGLALGSVLGADPLHWMLGSAPGLLVLATGLAAQVVGAWWAWRIAVGLEATL